MRISRWISGAVLFILLAAAIVMALVVERSRSYQSTLFAMDTFIEIRFYGRRGEEAADQLAAEFNGLEAAVSPEATGSDLLRLGESAGNGQPIAVKKETFRLLQKAKDYSLASNETFDLTVSPLVGLWDVTSDRPRVPSQAAIADARALVDANDLILMENTNGEPTARLRRSGQGVDLGGIAKGEAAQMALEVMDAYGIKNGFVSLGGNLAVRGVRPDTGKDFIFGVRDPRGAANEYIGTVTLRDRTMATTGDYERFFEQDGVRYHHVFDPRTGRPAENGWISVSVISADGALADFLSTALFVAGKEAVLAECMRDERYAVIAVDTARQVYISPSLKGRFKPNPDQTQFRFHFVGEEGGEN